MLDHASGGAVKGSRCRTHVVEEPIPIRFHIVRIQCARISRRGEGLSQGSGEPLEVVKMPVLMAERIVGGGARQATIQINGGAKRHANHLSITHVSPLAIRLEAPGVLVSIPATGAEPCQRYACDAHPGVSLKNEPYAHRRGLHRKDYLEVVSNAEESVR
jgi:hypothetical protein